MQLAWRIADAVAPDAPLPGTQRGTRVYAAASSALAALRRTRLFQYGGPRAGARVGASVAEVARDSLGVGDHREQAHASSHRGRRSPRRAASPKPWTHYFVPFDSVSRLGYILVDSLLATDAKAHYERRGLTRKRRADKDEQVAEHRYPTIGHVGTEASDHCLVSVDLTLPPRSKLDDVLR